MVLPVLAHELDRARYYKGEPDEGEDGNYFCFMERPNEATFVLRKSKTGDEGVYHLTEAARLIVVRCHAKLKGDRHYVFGKCSLGDALAAVNVAFDRIRHAIVTFLLPLCPTYDVMLHVCQYMRHFYTALLYYCHTDVQLTGHGFGGGFRNGVRLLSMEDNVGARLMEDLGLGTLGREGDERRVGVKVGERATDGTVGLGRCRREGPTKRDLQRHAKNGRQCYRRIKQIKALDAENKELRLHVQVGPSSLWRAARRHLGQSLLVRRRGEHGSAGGHFAGKLCTIAGAAATAGDAGGQAEGGGTARGG